MNPPILFHTVKGEGAAVILLHGLFGSSDNLSRVAIELEKNYRVYRVDLRNHGASFHSKVMNYYAMVEDLNCFMKSLKINKAHIFGHSMGGKVAMLFSLYYPDNVDKLIVADIAPVEYPPHHVAIIKGLQSINLAQITNRKAADKQLAQYVDNIGVRQFLLRNLIVNKQDEFSFKCSLNFIEQGYHQIMKGNALTKIGPFHGDTLFIKGGDSDYILPEHQQVIKDYFSNAKAKIIQGAGHWLHAEKTVAFNKIVADFLAK